MAPWSQQLFFPHRCCSTSGTPSHLNFLTSNEKRGDGKGTQMSFSVRIFAPEPNNASLCQTVFAALFWDFLLKRLSSSPDVKVCFITNAGKACRCMKCANCLELPSKQSRTKWVWVFWKTQTSFFSLTFSQLSPRHTKNFLLGLSLWFERANMTNYLLQQNIRAGFSQGTYKAFRHVVDYATWNSLESFSSFLQSWCQEPHPLLLLRVSSRVTNFSNQARSHPSHENTIQHVIFCLFSWYLCKSYFVHSFIVKWGLFLINWEWNPPSYMNHNTHTLLGFPKEILLFIPSADLMSLHPQEAPNAATGAESKPEHLQESNHPKTAFTPPTPTH